MPKILVVDDERALTHALAIRLNASGYEVFTANNPDDAGVIALRERPAAIILDVDMPPYSGLEFQACLKFAERGRDIAIIIMSGHDTDMNRRLAFEQGAKGFVTKPIHWPSFLNTIRNVIERPAASITP